MSNCSKFLLCVLCTCALVTSARGATTYEVRTLAVLDGEASGDWFGWGTSPLGDINNDGFADFVVGAPYNNTGGSFAGRAYVYLGAPALGNLPGLVITGQPNDALGTHSAGVGDPNGDGYADFLVSSMGYTYSRPGQSSLYLGGLVPDLVADLSFVGEGNHDDFGFDPEPLGDINGDGHDDFIMSAPWYSGGKAYIYLGGPGMDNVADFAITQGGELGCQTAPGCDFNGDGHNDLLIGAYKNGAGSAWIYLGGPGFDTVPDYTFVGEQGADWFGSVDRVGDLNGDGYNDVVIGAHRAQSQRGRVYVYFGGPALDTTADVILNGEFPGDSFSTVAGIGDVNQDGFADLMIGACYNDDAGTDAGKVYIYFGGPGFDATPDITMTGEAAGDMYGAYCVGLGDVDGNHVPDFAVTAALHDGAGTDAGRVYVYSLSVSGRWTQVMPVGPLPGTRQAHAVVYDSTRDRLVMFGGLTNYTSNYNDAWFMPLSGMPKWTDLAPSGVRPHPRQSHSAIYDPVRDRMIVFGGFTYDGRMLFNETWELSFAPAPHWTQLTPSGTPPSPRDGTAVIYDPIRDRMLCFGGYDGAFRTDLWELSLSGAPAWTQLAPAGSTPTASGGQGAFYDPVRDRMVLFGGTDTVTHGAVGDVWTLSLGGSLEWTHLAPANPPVARGGAAAVYDATRDRMVIFGGSRIDRPAYTGVDEVWELALGGAATWTQLSPVGTPPSGRYGAAAIYDPARDRMVIVAGEAGYANYQNDAWSLDWSSGAGFAAMACPPELIIPGYSTVHSLSLAGFRITNADILPHSYHYALSASGPATLVDKGDPSALIGDTPLLNPGASFYPPEAGLIIPEIRDYSEAHVAYRIFDEPGSSCTTTIIMEPPVPVLISSFNGSVSDDGVAFDWDVVSDEVIAGFRIYRSGGNRLLGELLTPALLGPTTRTYLDASVAAGKTYSYALEVLLESGSVMRSPVITVKTRANVLALHQNVPNPFNPRTTIAFILPAPARVTLAVYDVEGRLVKVLADAALGEGPHEYVWDGTDTSGAWVSSGVYFYRLAGSAQPLTKKMVLLK